MLLGKIDFGQGDEGRVMPPFVAKIDQQDERKPQIGGYDALPIAFIAEKGLIVLTEYDDGTEQDGEIYAEGKERGTVGKFIETVSLREKGAAKAVMANGDAQPDNKSRHAGKIQQPGVGSPLANKGGQEGQKAAGCRCQKCISWYTAAIGAGE